MRTSPAPPRRGPHVRALAPPSGGAGGRREEARRDPVLFGGAWTRVLLPLSVASGGHGDLTVAGDAGNRPRARILHAGEH